MRIELQKSFIFDKNDVVMRVFLFCLITLFGTHISAQNLNWVSLEKAEEIQKQSPEKEIFINFYTKWCGYCKKMDRVTFKNDKLIDLLNTNYILVKFDAETKDEVTFHDKKYRFVKGGSGRGVNTFAYFKLKGRLGYPSSVILNNSGSVKYFMRGYLTPKELIRELETYTKKKA